MTRIAVMVLLGLFVMTTPASAQTAVNQMNLATTPDFVRRVEYSLVKAAIAIKNESTLALFHQQRAQWAGQVLARPLDVANQVVVAVVTHALIQGAVSSTDPVTKIVTTTTTATDTDIDNVVSALWNALAGAI